MAADINDLLRQGVISSRAANRQRLTDLANGNGQAPQQAGLSLGEILRSANQNQAAGQNMQLAQQFPPAVGGAVGSMMPEVKTQQWKQNIDVIRPGYGWRQWLGGKLSGDAVRRTGQDN